MNVLFVVNVVCLYGNGILLVFFLFLSKLILLFVLLVFFCFKVFFGFFCLYKNITFFFPFVECLFVFVSKIRMHIST